MRVPRDDGDAGDAEALPSTAGLNLRSLVDDELYAAGRAFFAKFRSAWGNLLMLLTTLEDFDGRHDLSPDERERLRYHFERAVQAAFYFQVDEDTGKIPFGNAAYGATKPEEIRRMHLDPVIVGVEEECVEARGGVIGMKPHALRQVALLALGAHVENVTVQVARNEGGMAIRVSSAPDVLDALGKPRTNKATSPIQMESDYRLFGTREEKLRTCKLQRLAWDRNALLLAPVFAEVSFPRPAAYRRRCVHGAQRAAAAASAAAHASFTVSAEEAAARRHMLDATHYTPKHERSENSDA